MDSAVAAHVSVRWGPADLLVYLDTGTGLDANREYVEEFADAVGAQLMDAPDAGVLRGPRRDRRLSGPRRARQDVPEAQGATDRPARDSLRRPQEHVGPPPVDWRAPAGRSGGWRTSRPSKTARGGRGTRRSTTGANRTAASTSTGSTSRKTTCGTISGAPVTASAAVSGRPRRKIDLEAAGHVDHADWLRNLET